MEANTPFHSQSAGGSPVYAELAVLGGRQEGSRHALSAPVTIVGRDKTATIRLDAPEIRSIHCVLLPLPSGLLIRAAKEGASVTVNGKDVSEQILRNGDRIAIGPFSFRVDSLQNEAMSTSLYPVIQPGEVEALRAQAAAVAAQQSDLAQQERELLQKQKALHKQEEQLAVRLEERRRKLLEKQEELRRERAKFREEEKESEKRLNELWAEAHAARKEGRETQNQAQQERKRCSELRQRLQQRYIRLEKALEKSLRDREKAIATREKALSKAEHCLEDEKECFKTERLRYNGEMELGRRQVQDGWAELKKAQKEWHQQQAQQAKELKHQSREIRLSRAQITEAHQVLIDQHLIAESARENLEREARGLDARARSLREQIHSLEKGLIEKGGSTGNIWHGSESPAPNGSEPLLPEEVAKLLPRLEQVASDLEDQRRALLEQWEIFLLEQLQWKEEHAILLPEVERAVEELQQREQAILSRELELDAMDKQLLERQEEIRCKELAVEATRSQWIIQETEWHTERGRLLSELHLRESLLKKEQDDFTKLRDRWRTNRQKEVQLLKRELSRCREMHLEYAQSLSKYQKLYHRVSEEKRALAERSMALEQLQIEMAGRSENSVATDKKIQRLEKEWQGLHAEAEEEIHRREVALRKEGAKLEALGQTLHLRATDLLRDETTLSVSQSTFEHRQVLDEQTRYRQTQELFTLRQKEEQARQFAEQLQQELERLMSLLLTDGEHQPSQKAA